MISQKKKTLKQLTTCSKFIYIFVICFPSGERSPLYEGSHERSGDAQRMRDYVWLWGW